MMNLSRTLISLSEGDKRLIFSILLIVIVLLVLIALLGYVLVRIMKWQGKKMDTLIHDVVVYKVITDKKHLISYGRKKNWALFFKQAYIPFTIIVLGILMLIIRCSITGDWQYHLFSTENGFGTIFWTWRASGEFTGSEYDLVRFQKIVLDNTPHLVGDAWASYIAGPCFFIGGTWYFIVIMSLLARTIKLYKRSKEVFEKSLDGFNQTETIKVESNEANKTE